MSRALPSLVVLLALALALALGPVLRAQTPDAASGRTVLPGLHLLPVPELLPAHVPQLPAGQGMAVDKIVADSVAAKLGLLRHDVLLSYDEQPLRDLDQFNRVVLAAKVDHKASLVLLRAGKEIKLDVALHTAEAVANTVRGTIKPGGPPAVAIECTFLDGGKMQIVFAYYSDTNSKLETVTCTGSLPEIEQQVRARQMPARVQDLVDVALKRLKKG